MYVAGTCCAITDVHVQLQGTCKLMKQPDTGAISTPSKRLKSILECTICLLMDNCSNGGLVLTDLTISRNVAKGNIKSPGEWIMRQSGKSD